MINTFFINYNVKYRSLLSIACSYRHSNVKPPQFTENTHFGLHSPELIVNPVITEIMYSPVPAHAKMKLS